MDSRHVDLVRIALFAGTPRGRVKAQPKADPPPKPTPGLRRNGPCPCGSGKKFKKCCGAPRQKPLPRAQPQIHGAQLSPVVANTQAPADKQATAQAMLNAGVEKRIVWAYLETGLFITERNKAMQPPGALATWEAALAEWEKLPPEEQEIYVIEEPAS